MEKGKTRRSFNRKFVLYFLLVIICTFYLRILNYSQINVVYSTAINLCLFLFWGVVVLGIHELIHILAFKYQNIYIRAVFILVFAIIKENKWNFHLHRRPTSLFSGMVIPDLPAIRDREDFERIREAYANSIIAGPIGSILFAAITLALFMVLYLHNYNENSVIISCFYIILFTLLIIVSSWHISSDSIGDFVAYKIIKGNDFFIASQINQYLALSSQPCIRKNESKYLISYLYDCLKHQLDTQSIDANTLCLLDYEICLYLAKYDTSFDNIIEAYATYFAANPYILLEEESEISIILLFHVVCYLSKKKSTLKDAHRLFLLASKSERLPSKVLNYYKNQAEHLLKIKDNSKFLSDRKNIYLTTDFKTWSLFQQYYKIEERINNSSYAK